MYRKLAVVTIIVLLLSLAFASVSFAQTGTGTGTTQAQTNQSNNSANQTGKAQGGTWNSAYTSMGGTRTLRAGQQEWFAFEYAGDNSPIQIRLRNASNMQFSVWTQQDIQNAAGNFGMAAQPVGRSTPNDQFGGDAYWTGSFNAPGTYYVMVENANGGQGGRYTLEVTGSGVTWRGAGNSNNASNNNNSGNNNAGKTSASTSANTNAGSNTSAGNNTSGNTSGSTSSNTSGSTSSNTSSGNNTSGSTSSQGGLAPTTIPRTGGEMASVFPMLLGGIGALSVAAGALLRRKK